MNGLQGKQLTVANQYVEVAVMPDATEVSYGTMSIMAVNLDVNTDATIRVALTTNAGNPAALDHIEHGAQIPSAGGKYREECILVSPGERVLVWSDVSGVPIRVAAVFEAAVTP